VLGFAEYVIDRTGLHNPPVIDHRHLVGHIGNHTQVVSNQQDRHIEAFLQVFQQLQDLRLNGHIKRCRRLVGNQQRRAADQRHGNHRALTQAARKLKRIHVKGPRRIGKSDQPQHLLGLGPRICLVDLLVQHQRFLDLVANGVQRRQRRHRFLKNHGDAAATQAAHFRTARQQLLDLDRFAWPVRVIERNGPAGNRAGLGQDAHDRLADNRFARTGLAYQRRHLARTDAEAGTANRFDNCRVNPEVDVKILDAQKIGGELMCPASRQLSRYGSQTGKHAGRRHTPFHPEGTRRLAHQPVCTQSNTGM
jgi:hypothetical protein